MQDICDRKECPAIAQVKIHIGDSELDLCAHHFNDNHEALYELLDANKLTIEFTIDAEWLRRPVQPELALVPAVL